MTGIKEFRERAVGLKLEDGRFAVGLLQFTVAAILRLVDQGSIAIDKHASNFIGRQHPTEHTPPNDEGVVLPQHETPGANAI